MAPTAGAWLYKQLFALRLTLREFIRGYLVGKEETEARDWDSVQQRVVDDTHLDLDLSFGEQTNDEKPSTSATKSDATRRRQSTATEKADATKVSTAKTAERLSVIDRVSPYEQADITIRPRLGQHHLHSTKFRKKSDKDGER